MQWYLGRKCSPTVEAMKKEWQGLIDQGVFDLSEIRKYHDVVCDAKRKGEEVHMARAHSIIVEKHPQLAENDPKRNTCRADFLGCLDGWNVQMVDAVQAYIQAVLHGTICWIELPPEAVPDEVKELWNNFKRLVARLVKALCGRPDAGTFWEQRSDESVRAVGFKPVGEELPLVYTHEKL